MLWFYRGNTAIMMPSGFTSWKEESKFIDSHKSPPINSHITARHFISCNFDVENSPNGSTYLWKTLIPQAAQLPFWCGVHFSWWRLLHHDSSGSKQMYCGFCCLLFVQIYTERVWYKLTVFFFFISKWPLPAWDHKTWRFGFLCVGMFTLKAIFTPSSPLFVLSLSHLPA